MMKKRGLSLLFGIVLTFAGYGQAQAMGGVMMLLGMGMMAGMLPGSGDAMHGQHAAASGHGDAGQGRSPQQQTSDGRRSGAVDADQNDPQPKVKRPEQEQPPEVHAH